MRNSRKNFSILIIVLLIVPIGLVFYTYNQPHRDINDEDSIISIMANQLFMEYEQNELAANIKFLDKAIIVNGKIDKLDTSSKNDIIVIFKKPDDFFGLSCSFDGGMKHLLSNKSIGDSLKLKGICKGYLSDVVLIDCIIIE